LVSILIVSKITLQIRFCTCVHVAFSLFAQQLTGLGFVGSFCEINCLVESFFFQLCLKLFLWWLFNRCCGNFSFKYCWVLKTFLWRYRESTIHDLLFVSALDFVFLNKRLVSWMEAHVHGLLGVLKKIWRLRWKHRWSLLLL